MSYWSYRNSRPDGHAVQPCVCMCVCVSGQWEPQRCCLCPPFFFLISALRKTSLQSSVSGAAECIGRVRAGVTWSWCLLYWRNRRPGCCTSQCTIQDCRAPGSGVREALLKMIRPASLRGNIQGNILFRKLPVFFCFFFCFSHFAWLSTVNWN